MYRSEEFDAIPITSSLRLDGGVSSYLDGVSFECIEVANNRIVLGVCASDGLACSLGSSRNM
jgi:hypothetical protein